MLNKGRQIKKTFWVKVEGDLAYGVRAMLYIADLPRDLGVVNPFAIFGAINVFGDFKKPIASKSCLSAALEGQEPISDDPLVSSRLYWHNLPHLPFSELVLVHINAVVRGMLNVEVRDGSAIWLRNRIKNLLAEGTQNQVKDTLLIHVEIEDDVNVRISLCHTLAKAFIVFDVENWGPELSSLQPSVAPFRNAVRTADWKAISDRAKKLVKAEDTQIQVKHILLSRVVTEDDGNVRISLCRTIANAFTVFGGEDGQEKELPAVYAESFESLPGRGLYATLSGLEKITEAVIKSSHGTDLVRAALSVNNKKLRVHTNVPNNLAVALNLVPKNLAAALYLASVCAAGDGSAYQWSTVLGDDVVVVAFDELETELTRPLPPGEVVMVTPWMAIGQLREKTHSALRDTYCLMDRFVVSQIGGLKGMQDNVLLSYAVLAGEQVWVRGFGLDLDTVLRYEGGDGYVMESKVDCLCGACDDDVERMVACDECNVWRHTKCSGIEDDELAPAYFVCSDCDAKRKRINGVAIATRKVREKVPTPRRLRTAHNDFNIISVRRHVWQSPENEDYNTEDYDVLKIMMILGLFVILGWKV
ncbi:PHD finger protein-like protein [Tanacetum coccineum]